jgi:hypothetical protein
MTDEELDNIEDTFIKYGVKSFASSSHMRTLIANIRADRQTIKDWESLSQRQSRELESERAKVAELEKNIKMINKLVMR